MDEREDRHYYKEWLQLSLIDRECKKIGLHISGGLDSALMTFLTAKFIYDNNLSAKIVPIHGWDVKRKHSYSPNTVKNILNVLRPMFSTVQIDDVHLYAYDKLSGEKKSKYSTPLLRLLYREKIVDEFAYGSTREPPIQDLKEMGIESIGRTAQIRSGGPMGAYTKKDIAELYKKYNLMDNLFPLTVSCVMDEPSGACKECWWCKERYWAFGRY